MLASVALAIVAAPPLVPNAWARGNEDDACFRAPVEGQRLRKEGRLQQARAQLAACARATCPAEIAEQCSRWASQVDDAIPSVVVGARDTRGNDLVDARVSIDGGPRLDTTGRAIELDPGSHTFVFERAGQLNVEMTRLLREGEKNRSVIATFRIPEPDSSPAPSAPKRPPRVVERPVPAAAWVLGGVGAVGLLSFATFGALGLRDHFANHCDTGCTPSEKDTSDLKFRIADISLGVGVLAFALAAGLYLWRPTVERPAVVRSVIRPAPGEGSVMEGVRF
jgi:hypothetical protein